MTEVVSIKFRNRGKMYFFSPGAMTLPVGENVVVETAKGLEIGYVLQGNHSIQDEQVVAPLRPVIRVATEDDMLVEDKCREQEKEAFGICRQRIAAHGLDMKLVDVECSFEGNKIIFFFSSEGRVDFRELVKDLASVFRTRIELRQIGVRDEARMLGGLGICGRTFCCGTFIGEFQPVSTKMAKTQSLSLNPSKISGCCGRLMCCLRYEQAAYEELVKTIPKNGVFVETPDGYGSVTQVNILRQTVRVKLDSPSEDAIRQYEADEVATVPGGRPKDGSEPPHVLVLKPKIEEKEKVVDWELPEVILSSQTEPDEQPVRKERRPRSGNATAGKKQPQAGNRQTRQNKTGKKSTAPKGERQEHDKPRPQKNKGPRSQQTNRPPSNISQVQTLTQNPRPKNQKSYYKKKPYKPRQKNQKGNAPKQDG